MESSFPLCFPPLWCFAWMLQHCFIQMGKIAPEAPQQSMPSHCAFRYETVCHTCTILDIHVAIACSSVLWTPSTSVSRHKCTCVCCQFTLVFLLYDSCPHNIRIDQIDHEFTWCFQLEISLLNMNDFPCGDSMGWLPGIHVAIAYHWLLLSIPN
jgi:hypothetical protein